MSEAAVWLPPVGRNPLITGRFIDQVDQLSGRKRIVLETRPIKPPHEISSQIVHGDENGLRLKAEFGPAWQEYLQRTQGGAASEAWRAAEVADSISALDAPRSIETMLRDNGVTMVAQLARMSDAQCGGDPVVLGWRQRARDFCAARVAPPDASHALTAENKALRERLEAACAENDRLKSTLAAMEAERDVPLGFGR
jgi:hypothetical protein